jgi:hypothetical protein
MNWLRNSKSPRRPAQPARFQPTFDKLEDRTVLSPVTFQMRPQFSSVTLDPILNVSGTDYPITPQQPGSLTTGYNGRQQGAVDFTANTIEFFDAGTNIFARDTLNGAPMQPLSGGGAGSEPADYGGYFSFLGDNFVALRGVAVGLISSAPITLTPTGGGAYSFPVNGLTYSLKAGILDYQTGFFGNGTTTFTGSTTNASAAVGTLTPAGASYNISIPVEGTIIVDLVTGVAFTTVNFDGAIGGILPPSPIPPAGNGGGVIDPASARAAGTQAAKPAIFDVNLESPVRAEAAKIVDASPMDVEAQETVVAVYAKPVSERQETAVSELFNDAFGL